jgi:hypothetical protein
MSNKITILLTKATPFTVRVKAPNKNNSLCQLGVMDLRKMEEKWVDSWEMRGILVEKRSTSLRMGFLSRID